MKKGRKPKSTEKPKEQITQEPVAVAEEKEEKKALKTVADGGINDAPSCPRCGKPSLTYYNSQLGAYTAYCTDLEGCKLVTGPWSTREEAREHWARVK